MTEQSGILQRASQYIFELFKDKLPEHLVYHNFSHTESVAAAARKLAKGMELGEDAIEIVTLAGWFHDAGFIEVYKGHEDVSKRIAEEYLRSEGVEQEKIEYVLGCIEATRMPQSPKNLLEEILCDADMSALGKKTSFERSQLLRIEWEKALGKTMTDEEWLRQDLNFLTSHKYFTRYAQEIYDQRKLENIRERDKQLRKLIKANQGVSQEKSSNEQAKTVQVIINESHSDNDSGSTVNVVGANTLGVAGQTDRKAGMLILANSLIMSFTIGFIIHTSVKDSVFVIPLFFLLSVCVLTVIFAILAIIPKASIVDFSENIFIRKQEYLRVSYFIFLFGLIGSLVLFLVAATTC